MKPHRVIPERSQSAPATCQRMVGNWLVGYECGQAMQLCITRNPIRGLPYDELVIRRCAAGHVEDSSGVAFLTLDDIQGDIQTEGV